MTDKLLYIETEYVTLMVKGKPFHQELPGVDMESAESSLEVRCREFGDVHRIRANISGDEAVLYSDADANAEQVYTIDGVGGGAAEAVQDEATGINEAGAAVKGSRFIAAHTDARFYGSGVISPLFFEQRNYELLVEPADGHSVEFRHVNPKLQAAVTEAGGRHSMLTGVLNFQNDIGYSDLVVLLDGKEYLRVRIEVFPSKLDYRKDYVEMMADIRNEVYNLVFDFLKKTYTTLDISPRKAETKVEFYAILERIYEGFIRAADMVLYRPHHILATDYEVLREHRIRHVDNRTIRYIERHPGDVLREGNRLLVSRALAPVRMVTYDTKENRLIRFVLESTARRLEAFRRSYLRQGRNSDMVEEWTDNAAASSNSGPAANKAASGADRVLLEHIDRMLEGIRRRTGRGFLAEVKPEMGDFGLSLVFTMAPGYRELYRYYLLLQHGLSVTGDMFDISRKDIAVLYEYWCFIKLNSLLRGKYRLVSQDVLRTRGNGMFVVLEKGQKSQIKYENPENGMRFTLSYNPTYNRLPTITQKPDNVLKLEKLGAGGVPQQYVFDAKYRIDAAAKGSYYAQLYKTPGPVEDTINTMHRYRDAIVYDMAKNVENGQSAGVQVSGAVNGQYARTMVGAYVLFPYHDEVEYREHKFYKSIEKVNIGGLPFLPSATKLVEELLTGIIR